MLEPVSLKLKSLDIQYDLEISKKPKHIYKKIKELPFEEYDKICCIGGDGSMHEVINGIMDRSDNKFLPIGLVTAGTGNAFMRDINALNPMIALEKIINNKKREIDIFECKTSNKKFYAFNVVGWGIPSDVNILAEKIRWVGGQRYNIASIIEVIRKKQRIATLQFNNQEIHDDFGFIMACNTIHTGKGMKIAPEAKIDDGLLDLLVVRNISRAKLLRLFTKIFDGSHINHEDVEYYKTTDLKIITSEKSMLNVDGDNKGFSPVEIKLLPNAIEIFN